jgi:hypothetical protein
LLRTRINVPGGTLSCLSALLVLHSKTPARSACEASFSKETTEQRHLAHLCLCAVSLTRVFQKNNQNNQAFATRTSNFCRCCSNFLFAYYESVSRRSSGHGVLQSKTSETERERKFLAGEFNACTRVVSKQKNYVTKPRNRIPYDANTPTSSNSGGSTTPSTSCRRSTRTSF